MATTTAPTWELGEYLKQLRGDRSQRTAAQLAGVSQGYLSKLENGTNRDPRPVLLARCVTALGGDPQHARSLLQAERDREWQAALEAASATPRLLRCFQLSDLGRALSPRPLQVAL